MKQILTRVPKLKNCPYISTAIFFARVQSLTQYSNNFNLNSREFRTFCRDYPQIKDVAISEGYLILKYHHSDGKLSPAKCATYCITKKFIDLQQEIVEISDYKFELFCRKIKNFAVNTLKSINNIFKTIKNITSKTKTFIKSWFNTMSIGESVVSHLLTYGYIQIGDTVFSRKKIDNVPIKNYEYYTEFIK